MNKILIFLSGATIGAGAAYYFTKKYYERIANEEIEEVRTHFEQREKARKYDTTTKEFPEDITPHEFVKIDEDGEEEHIIATDFDSAEEVEYWREHGGTFQDPYVIAYDDIFDVGFVEHDWDTVELTYYADDILADELDDRFLDAEYLIGDDFRYHFGDYDENMVIIRNEEQRTDYIIRKDSRHFSEISKKPHRVRDGDDE